ncbi:hypothetical protein OAJ11_00995 [Candidatus Poseidoniales archaeon]|nr:hypothetical protein [Candidatus Poseidoniales archaeon]
MARPKSSWGQMISAGSNLYQNKQLAQQTAQNEAMILQMEQQAMMQRMQEMRRQNIIEARKTVVKLDKFAEKAIAVAESYSVYALMMTGRVLDLVRQTGLNADFFEEIADMERAVQMNEKLEAAESSIRSSMSEDQISYSTRMQRFIDIEEDEMEAHIGDCKSNEDWSKNSAEFAEVDSLHQGRKKKFMIYMGASLGISLILLIAAFAMSGECIETDADDYCVTWENESMVISVIIGAGLLGFLGAFIGGIPGFFWSRKYQKQWKPLADQFSYVEQIKDRFHSMAKKYGSTSSVEISDKRSSMIAWVEKMTPSDPSMLLDLD